MNVLESSLGETGIDYLIDNFTLAIPGTLPNCVDQSNSLTIQGQHGIGNLTVAIFNFTTDPITSWSSTNASAFSPGCAVPTSMMNSYLVPHLTLAVLKHVTSICKTYILLAARFISFDLYIIL